MRGRDATFLTHTRTHTHTLTRMLFSYNPKSPGEHLVEPPPQCGACGGIPQASHGVGSVLILLFTVVRAETKASVCRPCCRLIDFKIFLQCNLKQEQGSCRRQAPVGLSIEMFKCKEEGRREEKRSKQYLHPTLLTTQAALNSSSHCGYFGSLKN